jgi:hypothetical protein
MIDGYKLEDVEFKGRAYKRKKRKVVDGTNSGIIYITKRFIGKEFDVILIPREDEKTEQQVPAQTA